MGKRTGRPRGRPPGSPNRYEKALAVIIPLSSRGPDAVPPNLGGGRLDPVEVMLDNLEWAMGRGAELLKEIHDDPRALPETKLYTYMELIKLRGLAHNFAKDVAQYKHPKLSATKPLPPAPEDKGPIADPHYEHLKTAVQFFRKEAVNG